MQRWFWLAAVAAVGYLVFGRADSMPLEKLQPFDGRGGQAAAERYVGGSCAKERCLLVYLAPWCPQCRRAHSVILEAAEHLRAQGIETTVVIGLDDRAEIEAYARDFPFPVYLDPDRKFYEQLDTRGVPYFALWQRDRKIIEDIAGRPESLRDLLHFLELPQ
jgi:hypothetical protein